MTKKTNMSPQRSGSRAPAYRRKPPADAIDSHSLFTVIVITGNSDVNEINGLHAISAYRRKKGGACHQRIGTHSVVRVWQAPRRSRHPIALHYSALNMIV